ncbi:hypothetical protein [Paraburkholderia unamae]|uniref:Uncharacterized protein n=1 Tax=Paraburkholderia unamae TaxID=219649 RepID=A0ACC6RUA6_9BURK
MFQISPANEPDTGNAERPNVGAFISVKPEFQGVIDMTEGHFQQLLTLAASGRLAWCYVAFTTPYRRSALIVSVSFDTRPPDDEG